MLTLKPSEEYPTVLRHPRPKIVSALSHFSHCTKIGQQTSVSICMLRKHTATFEILRPEIGLLKHGYQIAWERSCSNCLIWPVVNKLAAAEVQVLVQGAKVLKPKLEPKLKRYKRRTKKKRRRK